MGKMNRKHLDQHRSLWDRSATDQISHSAMAAPYDTVHVGGLPPGTSEQSVREIFGQYAPIHASKLLDTAPGQAVEALVGIGKEASKWLVEMLGEKMCEHVISIKIIVLQ